MELERTDMAVEVKRMEVFNVWRNEKISGRKVHTVLKYFEDTMNYDEFDEVSRVKFRKIIENLCGQFVFKWKKSNRSLNTFLVQNKEWLDSFLTFESTRGELKNQLTAKRGRPNKCFNDRSRSANKRKVQGLVQASTSEELALATQLKLTREGKRDVAKVIKMVSSPTISPKRANKVKKRIITPIKSPTKITPERALALFVDNKFTKEQYIDIQQTTKAHNANIYPTYNRLLDAKKMCYPDDITITEVSGEVALQSLVNHTIKRLVAAQEEVLKQRVEEYNPTQIKITFKWGCDGASGHSRYMQAFENNDSDDASIYLISVVPLRMTAVSTTENREMILWKNPVPSSTKYCRPLRITFHKETADFIKQQVHDVKEQIQGLVPTEIDIEGTKHIFHAIFSLTMIDGKTCSTLSGTAAQNCHVCGASPKQMNDLQAIRTRPINENSLQLGLSSLHAWIKSMEYVLNISYRLDIKCWRISKDQKTMTELRKKEVQENLRQKLNILVDLPKQGYGSSNTGNVARTFFHNPELASEATGISKELIERLGTILRTISSGFAINISAFESFAAETANLCVQEYGWYYMPQSVHKILMHGSLIIDEALIPIGELSEEAQEHRNKDIRNFREFHSRKFSRKENVEDMFHLLMISSDPLISSVRRVKPKLSGSLPLSVMSLLNAPEEE